MWLDSIGDGQRLGVRRTFLDSVMTDSDDADLPFVDPDDVGVLLFTSGTTGDPKAAVLRLTECMAAEWGPEIRVNCLIPGFIDNPKGTPGRTPAAIEAAAN